MDVYSKVVLTIIAIALSVIALREAGVPAFAQSSAPVRVVICGASKSQRWSVRLCSNTHEQSGCRSLARCTMISSADEGYRLADRVAGSGISRKS